LLPGIPDPFGSGDSVILRVASLGIAELHSFVRKEQ
jgi:hypothetical protein